MSVQERVGMPLDEFIRSYDEAPFELNDGERILLVPPVAEHGEVIAILLEALILYRQTYGHFIYYTEMPFVLESLPNWVKGSRVPDLCVEVISANDSYIDVDAKVERYLADGVRVVWVFNPRQKSIAIHTPDSIRRLSEDDALDGGEVLPSFSVPVGTLFGQQ